MAAGWSKRNGGSRRLLNRNGSAYQTCRPRCGLRRSLLRVVFIFTLLALTVRVSLPQSETIWTAYETPADLFRFLLGSRLCVWFIFQLFHGPRRCRGYRTWLYLGLVAVPFALICLFAVW